MIIKCLVDICVPKVPVYHYKLVSVVLRNTLSHG